MFLSVIPKIEKSNYRAHVYLFSFFPDLDKDSQRPFIYREANDGYLMLSRIKPAVPCINIDKRIIGGHVYGFDLLCCPQRGCHNGLPRGSRKGAKPARYTKHNELAEWLGRRLEDGAEVGYVRSKVLPPRYMVKNGKRFAQHTVSISGSLTIKNRSAFIQKLVGGIGPKGFMGFGMLVLPAVMADAKELQYAAT